MSHHIAIIGAGIGGLTSALALANAGHRITLIERSTGFSEVGAGLQLSPNASRILIALGLGPALQRAASDPTRVVIRSMKSGNRIGEIALRDHMQSTYQAPYWVIHRADLQTILLDAVRSRPNIQLLVGRTVTNATQDNTGVSVAITTAGGALENLQADMLIGADGVRSTIRKVIGDTRSPVYQGYIAWRTTIDSQLAPASLPRDETGLWLGTHGHVVHYPIKNGSLTNIVAIQRSKEPVEGWTAPGKLSDLLVSYGTIAPELKQLLSSQNDWLLWSLAYVTAQKMFQGRIALLGDAVHPVLPFLAQGAALAIEDAACIVQELAASPDNITQALASYHAKRIDRARKVQDNSKRNGKIYHAPALIAVPRNMVISRSGPTGMVKRYDWLYGYKG
ncbi:FAD-dependent oxidoreductase [Microvirga sp. W0021]|uniref:FAD-dependent oxidoreductase n=1 Tax=Hohaiivirga grylli TaxID=3133970 RepID=A0ABV0BKQ2_9HYPH